MYWYGTTKQALHWFHRYDAHPDKMNPMMRRLLISASLVWSAFMAIAITSGALREGLLTPRLGELMAHQIGTVFVCLIFVGVIFGFVRRLRPTPGQAFAIGAGWAVMTVGFEFGVFHFIVGHPMSELLAAYNLAAGRLWPLVLLTELLAPWLFARTLPPATATPAELPARKSRVHTSRLPEAFRRTISREEIATLPIRRYTGEVWLVNTPQALAEAMQDIRLERVLGFDTETRPAFTKDESYLPCLVQIATANRVYLLQLEQLDCSRELIELMSNLRLIKTGVAIAGDVGQLKRLFPFNATAVVDLGHIAKRHGNSQTGLRNLVALFLGWRMTKGAKTTNWSKPQLTPVQIGYAATDAWASRELYLCFEQMGLLEKSGG
jgi:hypothetical protein